MNALVYVDNVSNKVARNEKQKNYVGFLIHTKNMANFEAFL